jgi:hypothetical protein
LFCFFIVSHTFLFMLTASCFPIKEEGVDNPEMRSLGRTSLLYHIRIYRKIIYKSRNLSMCTTVNYLSNIIEVMWIYCGSSWFQNAEPNAGAPKALIPPFSKYKVNGDCQRGICCGYRQRRMPSTGASFLTAALDKNRCQCHVAICSIPMFIRNFCRLDSQGR